MIVMKELGIAARFLDRFASEFDKQDLGKSNLKISKVYLSLQAGETRHVSEFLIAPSDNPDRGKITDHLRHKFQDLAKDDPIISIELQYIASYVDSYYCWVRQQATSDCITFDLEKSYSLIELRKRLSDKLLPAGVVLKSGDELFSGTLYKEYASFTQNFTATLTDFLPKNIPESFRSTAIKIRLTLKVDGECRIVDCDVPIKNRTLVTIPAIILRLVDEMHLVTFSSNSLTIDADIFFKNAQSKYLWVEYRSSVPSSNQKINPSISTLADQTNLLDNYRIFKSLSNGTDDDADVSFLYGNGFAQGALTPSVPQGVGFLDQLRNRMPQCNLL